jgi:ADP-ribosylglycohydrolase
MALCLAESLVETGGFDPQDQLERYVMWLREGHLSSTGRCFDIGNTVHSALRRFERTGEPYCGSEDPMTAGNGSIMRLAPVPLFYADSPEEAVARAADSSRTTHAAREAVDACRYLAALMVGAIKGATKDELLGSMFEPVAGIWNREPLAPKVAEIARGSFLRKNPPEIRGTGYCVQSLEAALWAFGKGRSFEESVIIAVNLGDDSDTTGAVLGQLAGAYYGESGIPEHWRARLAMREVIEGFADRLWEMSKKSGRMRRR